MSLVILGLLTVTAGLGTGCVRELFIGDVQGRSVET